MNIELSEEDKRHIEETSEKFTSLGHKIIDLSDMLQKCQLAVKDLLMLMLELMDDDEMIELQNTEEKQKE